MRSFRIFRLQHLLDLNIPLILVLCSRILEVYFSRLRFLGTCLSRAGLCFWNHLVIAFPSLVLCGWRVCPPVVPGAPTPHLSSPWVYTAYSAVCCSVSQSCPTLCDLVDYPVHGILQARILEWITFPFSRGSSQPRDWTQVSHFAGGFVASWAISSAQSHPTLCNP